MNVGVYGLPRPMMPRADAPAANPARPWLITIVDLMMVLLAFFVLMFSMSRVEVRRFQEVSKSYGEAFGSVVTAVSQGTSSKLPRIADLPGDDVAYLGAVLKGAFADSATLKDVEFRSSPQYLVLSLPVTALFAPESRVFAAGARAPVFDLAGVLSNLKNRIAVVGTAAMSRNDADAAADWSLAIARAQAMADALKAGGYEQSVTVLGRGGAATDVAAAIGQIDILIMPERPAP